MPPYQLFLEAQQEDRERAPDAQEILRVVQEAHFA